MQLGQIRAFLAVCEAGRLRAAVVQSELARVREELSESRGGTEGSASFGMGPAGIGLVPEAIARFRAERPNARIRIREGTRDVLMPLVRDGSLDFAIAERGFAPVEGCLVFRMLWQSDLVIVVRRGNPLARATSLAQLGSVPWLMIYRLGWAGCSSKPSLPRACHLPTCACTANRTPLRWR